MYNSGATPPMLMSFHQNPNFLLVVRCQGNLQFSPSRMSGIVNTSLHWATVNGTGSTPE